MTNSPTKSARLLTGTGRQKQAGFPFDYHHDRLGSTDYLTNNNSAASGAPDGKVESYVTYDDWGKPTMKAILKMGVRELDLVTEYTGYAFDQALGIYYAKAG